MYLPECFKKLEDLDNLEQDMNTALALIERDFPVSAQVGSLLLMFYYGIFFHR